MVITSYSPHLVHELFTPEKSISVVLMCDILFDDIFLHPFTSLFIFAIVFNVTIHLAFEPNKFLDGYASGLILEFPDDFLIC